MGTPPNTTKPNETQTILGQCRKIIFQTHWSGSMSDITGVKNLQVTDSHQLWHNWTGWLNCPATSSVFGRMVQTDQTDGGFSTCNSMHRNGWVVGRFPYQFQQKILYIWTSQLAVLRSEGHFCVLNGHPRRNWWHVSNTTCGGLAAGFVDRGLAWAKIHGTSKIGWVVGF